MRYAVEIGPGAMMYTKFNEDWFKHSNLIGAFTDTQAAWRSHNPTFISSK
jgi:hypothetical protein